MIEDIVNIVLKVLIDEDGSSSYKNLVLNSGCSDKEIRDALTHLQDAELLNRENNVYILVRRLRGMQIAKAAQFGIDVIEYDFFFEMTEKDKQDAVDFVNNTENVKKLEVIKRKPLILKRNYLITEKIDGVHENLMVIFETTNAMLYEHLNNLEKNDEKLKMLLEMHMKAENSLRVYVENNSR